MAMATASANSTFVDGNESESTSSTVTVRASPVSARPRLGVAQDDALAADTASSSSASTCAPPSVHLNLDTYPTHDLLRLLAALLQQLARANDRLPSPAPTGPGRDAAPSSTGLEPSPTSALPVPSTSVPPDTLPSPDAPFPPSYDDEGRGLTSAARAALDKPGGGLCFRARQVPSISVEAYLMRIFKYCPTTNEVFVSLLVYYDRMTRLSATHRALRGAVHEMTWNRGFVLDSFNLHRLIIAGVTVASKFFSDVFYTNARYAKVGGLNVAELNQLELQFLLLNDFDLSIPLAEMQGYADQLLHFGLGRPPTPSSPLPRSRPQRP